MTNLTELENKKIAVIGAGAAGIVSAHLLSKKHHVTLFESSPQLGGHAHAVTCTQTDGSRFPVDTAFLIFNERSYPTFLGFLKELGVYESTIPAEMSSCFSDEVNGLHYALGNGWGPVLRRPQNYARKELFQIARDLYFFRRRAVSDLQMKKDLSQVTAGQYLEPYSKPFVENFVLPLTSAIWSLPTVTMNDYPIASLLHYFDNHQLLGKPQGKFWRTFAGSSRVYLEAFEKQFKGTIRKNAKITSVIRKPESVQIQTDSGTMSFDHVVLATHADVARQLISNPTPLESELLGAWQYQDNPVTLHHEPKFLYADRRFWCSWNMVRRAEDYQISYYLNRLQKLPTQNPVILTLGNLTNLTSASQSFNYRHPVFNTKSVATQKKLEQLNGADRLHFCGSYFGYGFHEDAMVSATNVARNFGTDWKKE